MSTRRRQAHSLSPTETQVFDRARLLVDLDEATDESSAPSTLLVVGYRRRRHNPDTALTRTDEALLGRLGELLGEVGPVYRTRSTEVCALVDLDEDDLDDLISEIKLLLVEHQRGATVAVGTATVPGEASDAVSALALADARLLTRATGRTSPHVTPPSAPPKLTLLQWR